MIFELGEFQKFNFPLINEVSFRMEKFTDQISEISSAHFRCSDFPNKTVSITTAETLYNTCDSEIANHENVALLETLFYFLDFEKSQQFHMESPYVFSVAVGEASIPSKFGWVKYLVVGYLRANFCANWIAGCRENGFSFCIKNS
jgi:hypothetical protein